MPTVKEIIDTGFNYHQDGNLVDAENAYKQALLMDEENSDLCNLMGVLKLQKNEIEDAICWVEKAVKLNPSEYYFETLFQAYIRGNKFDKIVKLANEVLKKFPQNFSLLFNIAMAYKNLNNNKMAISYYDKALKVDPTSYQAWFNLSHIYSIEGQYKNALSALKICKKLKPNDNDTNYFLSLAYMQTKNYDKGLKLFENRLCRETAVAIHEKTYPTLGSRERLWHGENIKDKTILVYYEAGFGDTIMFARYLPLLKNRCKKLIFAPQKPLIPLFVESGLGVDDLIEGYIPEKMLEYDVHAPLLSLPYLLGLKGNQVFESPEGYMWANADLVEKFRKKYFDNDKFKIGIKWQGNTYYDQERVIPVEAFEPIIKRENTQVYSFQTFEGSKEVKKLEKYENVTDVTSDLIDFGQTAAALMSLDLVICNDTSLAHLAGALGVPCCVALPYQVNWRWHDDLSKCDWYDSLKLFRQKSAGDWQSVFEEISQAIK